MKETKKPKATEGAQKGGNKANASVASSKTTRCPEYHGGTCSGKCKLRTGHTGDHVCEIGDVRF
jgi:hypothetical protein